jgi:hypothetical protein
LSEYILPTESVCQAKERDPGEQKVLKHKNSIKQTESNKTDCKGLGAESIKDKSKSYYQRQSGTGINPTGEAYRYFMNAPLTK